MGMGSGVITGTFFGALWFLLIALTLFKIFAFVDALVRPRAAFEAAGKLTKIAWLLFLGIAAFYDVMWGSVTAILTILGTVAAIVYVVDVRPAIKAITPAKRSKGSQNGPYGSR